MNRVINYLRISVTDRCNMRCVYCMPPEGVPSIPHDEILRFEEIVKVAGAALDLGINRFRISGGEPLLRKSICVLIGKLTDLPGLKTLSLTTNGLLLDKFAADLAELGITSINVSLDTLSAGRMLRFCRAGHPDRVVAGIDAALSHGIPVKINTVMSRSVLDELDELLDFAEQRGLPLRFIEFMPIDPVTAACSKDEMISESDLKDALEKIGPLEAAPSPAGSGPASYFRLKGRKVVIGMICALSSPFCDSCNRIRLTADGKLKPCLAGKLEFDVKKLLRGGASGQAIKSLLERTIRAKPGRHHLGDGSHPGRSMNLIGG